MADQGEVRVKLHEKATAPDACKPMLETVEKGMGWVPNILKAMANSPVALKVYLALSGALKESTLSPRAREALSLAIVQETKCCYCLSAHAMMAKGAGFTPEQIEAARAGKSRDRKEQAALDIALAMVRNDGFVDDKLIAAGRQAGLTDAELAEIAAVVALNLYTSYFNHLVQTPLDFPPALNLPQHG
jgi:uncharacterized peroxidase-related enzyme